MTERNEHFHDASDGPSQVLPGAQISAASIQKIPPFWKECPQLWFIQVESIFALAGITRDDTKYNYIVGTLDSSVMQFIGDLVINPPAGEKYLAIKERLLSSFEESEESKIRKLLRGKELGDQKPSHFLSTMKMLAGTQISDVVLKSLFVEQLPEKVRAILAISQEVNLKNLAEQADKIMELSRPQAISAITGEPMQVNDITSLQNEIAELSKKFEVLAYGSHKRSHSRNTSRTRSQSRKKYDVCWYHFKFGINAKKCNPPCKFSKN